MKKRKDFLSSFADFLAQETLNSDEPEYKKMSVRILLKTKEISEVLTELIDKYVGKVEANVETLTNVLEYLETVEVGIKQFIENTPYVAHTEEEDNG